MMEDDITYWVMNSVNSAFVIFMGSRFKPFILILFYRTFYGFTAAQRAAVKHLQTSRHRQRPKQRAVSPGETS